MARDLRTPALYAALAVATVPAPILWTLVALGALDPLLASDLMALGVASGFAGAVIAPWLPNGDRPGDRWSRVLDLLLVWTVASTCAQLGWELPFVLLHPWLEGVTAADTWAWLWWAYGVADTRYLIADPFIVVMEGVTAILGGPLEVWIILQLRRGRFQRAAFATVVVGATQWYGTVLYFGLELFQGMVHVNTARPIDLWVKVVLLNAFWLVLPLVQVWAGYKALGLARERAPAAALAPAR